MSTCDSLAVSKYFIRGEGIVKVFNHNVNDSYGKKKSTPFCPANMKLRQNPPGGT